MKRNGVRHNNSVREFRFILSLFMTYTGVLLLMSGIHTGLVVLMAELRCREFTQIIVAMAYWGIVALGITWFTVSRIKKTYEIPMHQLAEATSKVAAGDFSVYVPTLHTADKLDYLDVMIMDFNKMVEELGSIETLKTDFISNVSHEMKTPIAIIKNYAELLQMGHMDEEQRREYAKSIEDAASRLSGLISNAIKFTEPGGSVAVRQTTDESYIRVAVSDTGCGMSQESRKHIFDKFYQGDTSHSSEGNGLGLALVKRVLELMDGDIHVVSEEGKGSTFTVTLPAADVYTEL